MEADPRHVKEVIRALGLEGASPVLTHLPQTSRSHQQETSPPDLEEIYEPRHLEQEEEEDDETETARTLSKPETRELFRQHRNLGHPQPTELARALRLAGARREAIRFVLKELRCPTCEARPLSLPHPC